MESTENSQDNTMWISPVLLDELIRQYQEAAGLYYNSQVELLQSDPETIIINLQRANGAGHMLKVIMSRIPKEVINECPIRSSVWNSLFGTFAGPTSGEGRRREPKKDQSKPGRGSQGKIKTRRRFFSNKSDPNRP